MHSPTDEAVTFNINYRNTHINYRHLTLLVLKVQLIPGNISDMVQNDTFCRHIKQCILLQYCNYDVKYVLA